MHIKFIKIFAILFISLLSIIPSNVNAYETYKVMDTEPATELDAQCKSNASCVSSAVLGDVNCECSIAWLLQKIINYMRIIGPTIAIILSSIDFAKAIIASDDSSFNKTKTKFVKRLILALFLFLIPTLVSVILGLFGITSNATGGLV